jgi:nucleoid DNA-binding protein
MQIIRKFQIHRKYSSSNENFFVPFFEMIRYDALVLFQIWRFMMNKKELISDISKKIGLSGTKVKECVEAVFGGISKALSKGESFILGGFGSFSVKKRSARKGRNPKTGESLKISAKKVVHFSVSKNLKQLVDKK